MESASGGQNSPLLFCEMAVTFCNSTFLQNSNPFEQRKQNTKINYIKADAINLFFPAKNVHLYIQPQFSQKVHSQIL